MAVGRDNPSENPALNEAQDLSFTDNFIVLPKKEKGRTVTVFLCGTCSKSSDYANKRYFDGENISQTFTITQGEEYIDKIIVDGPGSGELDADKLWIDYKPYSTDDGIRYGKGVSERINHIMAVLKGKPTLTDPAKADKIADIVARVNQANEKNPITQVNIVGWSRGAAAGITLANKMAMDSALSNITCNLVLLDPVPGLGLSDHFNTQLHNNVENCYTLYAEDERSVGFSPVVPRTTNPCLFPIVMPGGHAQLAGDEADHGGVKVEDADLRSAGKIARYIIQHILFHLGTDIDPEQISRLTLTDIQAEYVILMKNREAYKIAGTRVSYTYNQAIGTTRDVIGYGDKIFSSCFDQMIRREFPPHDKQYFDGFHFKLCHVIERAKGFTGLLTSNMAALFNTSRKLELDDCAAILSLQAWQSKLHGDALFCRAVSEELQKQCNPSDLLNVKHRHITRDGLKSYVKQLLAERIAIHNRKIDIVNEQARLNAVHRDTLLQLTELRQSLKQEKDGATLQSGRDLQRLSERESRIMARVSDVSLEAHLSPLAALIVNHKVKVRKHNADVATRNVSVCRSLPFVDAPGAEQIDEPSLFQRLVAKCDELSDQAAQLVEQKQEIKTQIQRLQDKEGAVRAMLADINSLLAQMNVISQKQIRNSRVDEAAGACIVANEQEQIQKALDTIDALIVTVQSRLPALAGAAELTLSCERELNQLKVIRAAIFGTISPLAVEGEKIVSDIRQMNAAQKSLTNNADTLIAGLTSRMTSLRSNLIGQLRDLHILVSSSKDMESIHDISDDARMALSLEQTQLRKMEQDKQALITLLKAERDRIDSSCKLFQKSHETGTKLAEIGRLIPLIERVNNLCMLKKLTDEMLHNDTITRHRSLYFKPLNVLGSCLGFFQHKSTMQTSLEKFVIDHELQKHRA